MNIHVQYLAQLREAVGRSNDVLEMPEGTSLAALLVYLAGRYGSDATRHLVTPGGEPQRCLLAVINDRAISPSEAVTTKLNCGDSVILIPPIAGG